MNRSSSNSSPRSLRNRINELESEIQNLKETFKYFFSNFPDYEKKNEVPVLENSDLIAGRIKKALTLNRGGVYTFDTKESDDAFVESELYAGVRGNSSYSNFMSKSFVNIDSLAKQSRGTE